MKKGVQFTLMVVGQQLVLPSPSELTRFLTRAILFFFCFYQEDRVQDERPSSTPFASPRSSRTRIPTVPTRRILSKA